MVVVGRKKSAPRHLTARLLVLGDSQVGKSAAIVRYTTGRYIHNYSDATNDWLYRHSLGLDAKRNVTTSAELLEQRDVQFCSSSQFFASSPSSQQAAECRQSLSSRVALDQQLSCELQEKQQLLDKLHWANAYVIIYAIDHMGSFNKAIKYLNLIANTINSGNSQPAAGASCAAGAGSTNVAPNGRLLSRLSPTSNQQQHLAKHLPHHPNCTAHCGPSACTCPAGYANIKRPILLLGNKKDLERSARQVNANDARLLAMRHQSMFAELSIADSSKLIQTVLANLIEQIDPSCLHVEQLNQLQQQQLLASPSPTALDHWSPPRELAFASATSSPVWGSLVRSKPLAAKSCANFELGAQSALTVQSSSVRVAKQLVARELTSNAEDTASSKSLQARHNRYENLKSSFRRASMAIVSGRANAKASARDADQKRHSMTQENEGPCKSSSASAMCPQQSSSPQVAAGVHHGPASWFKSHMRLSRDRVQADTKPDANSTTLSSRFRRPMMKYDIRRRTVAFELISPLGGQGKQSCSPESVCSKSQPNEMSSIETSSSQDTLLPAEDEKSKATVGRSSSSLSTTDRYYAQQFNSWAHERAPSSTGSASICSSNYSSGSNPAAKTIARHHSRSTLSHASTSGGSYEDSGDELSPLALINNARAEHKTRSASFNAKQDELARSTLPPLGSGSSQHKKRYQLVRSVQSTLLNLTKSSNISAQTAKKSFCHGLFSHSAADQRANSTVKSVTVPLVGDLAKTDQIQVRPVIGFCV